MFNSVDVSKCSCFKETDRLKLLGIVEHGFGDFDAFNTIVRHVFNERMSVPLTFEEWQLKLEEVAAETQRLRKRLLLCTCYIGGFGIFGIVVMGQLIVAEMLDSKTYGLPAIWSAFVTPAGSLLLLGMMANDVVG